MPSNAVVLAVKCVTEVTTMLVVFSPSVALHGIVKAGDVGTVSVLPILLLMTSSHIWVLYGAVANLIFPVFSSFLVGDIMTAVYLAIYWRFAPAQRVQILRRFLVVLAVLAIATLYAILGSLGRINQSRHGVVSTLGVLTDLGLVALYSAPLERVRLVLKHKSARYIQLPMVSAGLLNNVSWLTYGAVTSNWFIIGPNCFFIALHVFQIVLCILFRARTDTVSALAVANTTVGVDLIPIPTASNDQDNIAISPYKMIPSP